MRKRMSVHLPTFFKALESLGYREDHKGWRRGRFHIIVNQSKKYTDISLHVDISEYKVGPIHRSRQYGKDIIEEFEQILKEYRKLRASVMRQ